MTDARAFATPEASYYTPLVNLLNSIGNELNPKVVALGQISNIGYDTPDFGFYTATQTKRNKNQASANETPARGVAEVKTLNDNIDDLLNSEQITKYAQRYGLVLATNYRQFALAEYNNGKIKEISRYSFAATEEEFWKKAEDPQKFATESGVALCEFLRRALLYNAPINSAKEVAVVLASYARETLALLEQNNDDASVNILRTSLQNMLNMEFIGDEGAHFFRSTLSQTIFYGLFSAWMETSNEFDWRKASFAIKTPVMRALFAEIVNPDRLGRLGLEKSLDGATAALNRVRNKESLFGDMDAAKAIQHFYEPFLADFDPILRKELGVWYTPPEIVKYMVERADRVLREELKIPDGFADRNVYVLDPCGGTGAYIAEVLRRIHITCKERGDDDSAEVVSKAAQERVFGFEILPASYVVAHWQIGALLSELGSPLKKDERAAIYLTNSLTNWTEAKQPDLPLPALEEDRKAANKIKQDQPILVILGNPPYNAFAGTSPEEEEGIVMPYKEGLIGEWGIKKFNLDDLYVRFFRMAENRITKTGKGIVSFISNYSYTSEKSFVVMRQSLLKNFDKLWIENMHGDRNKTEYAPDGRSSDTIFSMRGVSPGIRQGIVIALALKTSASKESAVVRYRNDIDAAKADERRAQLLGSLNDPDFDSQYEIVTPQIWNKFSFCPMNTGEHYLQWNSLKDLCQNDYDSLLEKRGGALYGIDRDALENRMRYYFNKDVSWDEYQKSGKGLAKDAASFNAKETRKKALFVGFYPAQIVSYVMRPFDNGFCYYNKTPSMWNRPRPKLWEQYESGNSFIVSRSNNNMDNEGTQMFFTETIGDGGALRGGARYIPFSLYPEKDSSQNKEELKLNVSDTSQKKKANLSKKARQYLNDLGFTNPDKDTESAEIIWLHALAIGYSPAYQTENADGLKIDYPRIPLPTDKNILKQSAKLGEQLRALLDMQKPLVLQTANGKLLEDFAIPSGKMENLALTNLWCRVAAGKVYPGKGWAEPSDPTILGASLNIHINEKAYWQNVPKVAWEYRIGGFQVCKKWLSYRAERVLERSLKTEEVRIFADIVRRISAIILLQEELDKNYYAAKTPK